MSMSNLRFKLGERVIVQELDWMEGSITELRCITKRGHAAAYRVRSARDAKDVFILEDSTKLIRECVEPGAPRLMQSVKCGDSAEYVNSLCVQYDIDIRMIGKNLLLCAASSGNVAVAKWLIDKHNIDYLSGDENGRNILHLALMNKQFAFIESMPQCKEYSVTTAADSKGFNIFHFLVMSKNIAVLKDALYTGKFNFRSYQSGSTLEQGVVKLVDFYGERFGPAAPHRDAQSSAVSPLDWAKRTKQLEMADMLQKYLHELHVDRLLWEIRRKHSTCTDDEFLLKLKHIREKIAIYGLTLDQLFRVGEFFVTINFVKQDVMKHGMIKSLVYMDKNFTPSLMKIAFDPCKLAMVDIKNAIEGPDSQSFWPLVLENEAMDPNRLAAAAAFNLVAPEPGFWDVPDFAAYLENKKCSWKYEGQVYRCYQGLGDGQFCKDGEQEQWLSNVGDWMNNACEYIDKFILRTRGVLIEERIAIIEHRINQVRARLPRVQLPPHLFVHHGQLQLLQWAVAKQYVDLTAPAAQCEELVDYVERLPWLSLINKKKKKKKGAAAADPNAIPPHLTVGEVLCALAAGWGEYLIFRWLLEECIPREKHGMCVGGQSLLLIAAKQDRGIIIYYLANSAMDEADGKVLFFQYLEAVRESCQRGYFASGLMLISCSNVRSPLWESIHGIAVKAPNAALRYWAEMTCASFNAHKLLTFLDSAPTTKESTEQFDRCEFFVHDPLLKLDRPSFGSIEDVQEGGELLDVRDVNEKFSVLMILACHAVRRELLFLLRHILAAVAFHCPVPLLQSFIAEMTKYAQIQGNAAAMEVLAAAFEASEQANALLLIDVKHLIKEGASIAQVEELVNQAPVYKEGGGVQNRFASIARNELEVADWLTGLAEQGHVHCIKWLIEEAQLRPTFASASMMCVAATRAAQLPVLKYFLTEVFLRPKRLMPSDKPDENISSSALAALLDKVFNAIFAEMDILNTDILDSVVPLFEMLHSVLQDAVTYKLAIDVEAVLKEIISRTHWRDSERWWEVLRWMMGVEAYRAKLVSGDGYMSSVVGLTTVSVLGPERSAWTTKLLHFLMDHGANGALELERLAVSCQHIWDHHEPDSFVVVLKCFAARGFNIQNIMFALDYMHAIEQDASKVAAASVELEALKAEQRKCWAVAEAITAGRSVEFLQSLVEEEGAAPVPSMRNRQGHNLLQAAALSNRGEVILWLKETHHMDLTAVDGQGLSLLQLCRRAGALQAASVVEEAVYGEKVHTFCQRHFRRRRTLRLARADQAHRASCLVLLQSQLRGWSVRKRFGPLLKEVKGTYEAFISKWGGALNVLKFMKTRNVCAFSWAEQKFKFDMAVDARGEDVGREESVRDFALHAAATQPTVPSFAADLEFDAGATERGLSAVRLDEADSADDLDAVNAVEMSQAVQRWLDKADMAYRTMFYKKVARLAKGSRSYALSKRLKGCEYPICESKLDAGQRILWTSIGRDNKHNLLIWFVVKHDNVSRYADLIDSTLRRTFRSLNRPTGAGTTPPDLLLAEELLQLSEDSVLLNPSRNVPMKIYIAQRSELPLLAEKAWKAPLRMNQREQGVRSQTGTVLLLGRSGTGKTLCVMDRMNHDRKSSYLLHQQEGEGEVGNVGGFRQLFVTRSSALCDTVRTYQQHNSPAEELAHTTFFTFESFLRQLETTSSSGQQPVVVFNRAPAKKVDFQRFRDNVFPLLVTKSTHTLDALVVWTQIRSFLKGSIEAALEGGVLSLTTYLDSNKFSKDRCRLLPAQREEVFALFVQYQALHELHGWWDDMDRATDLLQPHLSNLQTGAGASLARGDFRYDKVYVDEVQDNTQVEIALYLVTVGGRVDALFLAGDPAQSVVEGVEFRFEEVRSLVYLLSHQQEALQRPTKLLVNYRSHSGILNCAGAVLGRMLAMFPGAAKTLPADEGLFLGPRPAFCNTALGMSGVAKLLATNERTVVLCPDQIVGDINDQLTTLREGDITYKASLVMGIRDAKGLEFTDIVLLDFFNAIPDSDYKAWKELLAVGGETGNSHATGGGGELQQYAFPQLEPQLKLLYTAITRSVNRLIFVESRRSRIGGLFFRWLKQHGLADAFTPHSEHSGPVSDADQVHTLMTRDEWRMRGIDFAVAAEGFTELLRAAQMLTQAALCFQRAEEPALKSVAVAHAALLHAHSVYCRNDLVGSQPVTDQRAVSSAEEVAMAGTVLRGLRVGLVKSTHQLCQAVEECLPVQSRKFFTTDLLHMF